MKNIWNKFNQWYDNKSNQITEPQTPTAIKMPLLSLMLGPYNFFMENAHKTLRLCAIFAFVMTFVFMLGNNGLMCNFSTNSMADSCTENTQLMAALRFVALYIIAVFTVRYYQYCYEEKTFSWSWLVIPQKNDIKTIGVIVVYLLLNMLSVLSTFLLIIRVPNPAWRIELGYFTIVSLGFIIPFLLLRFYSLGAFFLAEQTIPPLREVWTLTADNGVRLLIGFFLLFFVAFVSLNLVVNNFRLAAPENTLYISFMAEYLFNFILFLNITFLINYCVVQKKILYGEKEDD